MKKKILISVIVIVVLIILLISGIIISFQKNKEQSYEVIIESSYTTYAWEFKYSGVLICKDGTIYKFNISDKAEMSELMDLDLQSRYKKIIENSSKKNEKVSKIDLEDIIEYSKNIDYANYTQDNSKIMYDAGTNSTYVVLDNQKYSISSSGESNLKSNDENAEKLLEILDKYI